MDEWKFSRDKAAHGAGLVAHFIPLPHGTRGRNVAFQDHEGKRWIAQAEKLPPNTKPLEARRMLLSAGYEWVTWRGRSRSFTYK